MKLLATILPILLASTSVNSVAVPGDEFHVVKDTDGGPVYSNMPANRRRDNTETFHAVGVNEFGTVYSNVAPYDHQKREDSAYTSLSGDEVDVYIQEHGLTPHEKRDGLEKRDFAACVACVAACGLMQQGISLLSVSQQVQFCLGNCALQGACTTWFRARYGDTYGNTFPPRAQ